MGDSPRIHRSPLSPEGAIMIGHRCFLRGLALPLLFAGLLCPASTFVFGQQAAPRPPADKLASADKVTEGMELTAGFFRIYHKKGKMYLEIPRRVLKKPFFLATSFAGGNTFHGWQWSDQLVHWERFDNKLLLVEEDVRYRADARAPVSEAVRRTYSNRIVLALPIIAEGRGPQRGFVVDGKRLLADNARVFFGATAGNLNPSLAKFDKLKAFPNNCEIAVTMPTRTDGKLTTLHYSLARLPKSDYKPRVADDRIGYFLTAFKDFSKGDRNEGRFVRLINRWNLKKKDPSLAVSPPVRPIVFYVEKTVPVRYRRAVREGILEWNLAFEKIGFYNAIEVRQQTETEFSDLDPEDSRYNFFRWITSESAFAMGPSRVNPRTGEILDADVIFDDSMARFFLADYDRLLRDLPQTFFSPAMRRFYREHPHDAPFAGIESLRCRHGAEQQTQRNLFDEIPHENPAASRAFCRYGEGLVHQIGMAGLAHIALQGDKATEVPEEFVYSVIKETVMHEIGHTLGLRHNFKASTWKTQEQMNQAEYGEATTASVMDYNALNVVPGKEQQEHFITGTIGPYDYWAIEYGYAPGKSVKDLRKIASRSSEEGLAYGTDEDLWGGDPTIAQFDFGKDPLEYARQRLDLVRRLLPTLVDRVPAEGESFEKVRRAFDSLLYEVSSASAIAARHVGGVNLSRDHKGSPNYRPPVEVIPAEKQREALRLIREHIFSPTSLELPPSLLQHLAGSKWGHWGMGQAAASYPILDRIQGIQSMAVAMVTSPETLSRVRNNEMKVTEGSTLTIPELMSTLTDAIFEEGRAQQDLTLSPIRQNLQRIYLERLIRLTVGRSSGGPPIVPALARAQLIDIQTRLQRMSGRSGDVYTKAHVSDCDSRIERALRAEYQAQ